MVKKKHVAITGAGGFIGKYISEQLSQNKKFKVVSYSRKLPRKKKKKFCMLKKTY